jgi:uncharacterized protein YndB with AHSA1/START domain
MPNDLKPVVGHRFTFRTDPFPLTFDGVVRCQVLKMIPRTRINWSQQVGIGLTTTVSIDMSAQNGGTVLRLVHAGFDTSKPAIAATLRMLDNGWGKLHGRLSAVVARYVERT